MKVFISWSGERSKRVAELLDVWLRCTIQSLTPWISTRGIGRGELWFPAITKELAETSIGIVCLTSDNTDAPWILFEAGALAKGLASSRVITLLVDLDPNDITDPLAQFNHTLPTMESMKQLLETINTLSETRLDQPIVERVFEKYWPEFDTEFKKILADTPKGEKPKKRNTDDLMYEILNSVRVLDSRIRKAESFGLSQSKFERDSDINRMIQAANELRLENAKLKEDIAVQSLERDRFLKGRVNFKP